MHRVHQYDHVLKTKILNLIAFREDGWGIVLTFLFPLFSFSYVFRFFFFGGEGKRGRRSGLGVGPGGYSLIQAICRSSRAFTPPLSPEASYVKGKNWVSTT